MSAAPAPIVAIPPVRPSLGSMSVAWARVVGAGSVRRDFGHHVASNAAGEVLIAARLERLDEAAVASDAAYAGELSDAGAPPSADDPPAGRLLKLAPGGGPVWTLLLRGSGPLTAPAVALDGAGAAYIAGPYEPDDAGVAVGSSGAIGLVIAVQSAARDGHPARRGFVLLRSNAAGGARKRLHGVCNAHGLISSLHLAPSAGDAFVLAGSFSGVLTLEKESLRSPTQAGEAVFAMHAGADGAMFSLVLPLPQLWGGLSVHDAGDGGALVAGWMCGAATIGEHRIASPRDRAVLFLGVPMPSVARTQGIPVNTGYTRLHVARARFRDCLERILAQRRMEGWELL